MTDLTKQWKKGELLDEEDYYIKWKDSEVFTATFVDFMNRKMFQRMTLEFEELPTEHYLSVLAPVPSYEEWKFAQEQLHKEGTWYTERAYKNVRKAVRELAQKLLQVKPELREWLEVNYGEYL